MKSLGLAGFLLSCGLIGAACSSTSADPSPADKPSGTPSTTPAPSTTAQAIATGSGTATASAPPPATAAPSAGPGALDVSGIDPDRELYASLRELIGFVEVKKPETLKKRWKDPTDLLDQTFGVGSVWFSNQGNRAISHTHSSRKACLDGLKGTVLQTPDQRKLCGADYMVPIYKDGDPSSAKTCIDIFEFPNRPCELPVVWISPSRAKEVCQLEGKRLCSQDEWVLACRGNPEGPDLQDYAYGTDLDLTACHTRGQRSANCDPTTVKTTWATCATDTAPVGSFPRCRSRFGVFDQHGNVAEIMQRWDPERERTVTQLKGSAFFYEKISMKPTDPPNKQKYPDHCAHDPRWHVENLETAGHMMYHLGFRCCKDIQ